MSVGIFLIVSRYRRAQLCGPVALGSIRKVTESREQDYKQQHCVVSASAPLVFNDAGLEPVSQTDSSPQVAFGHGV